MKEITINIPDDSSDLVIDLVERLGGSVDIKERINQGVEKIKNKPKKKLTLSKKKAKKDKIDHNYLFGKWKDFNIDAKKLRKESW